MLHLLLVGLAVDWSYIGAMLTEHSPQEPSPMLRSAGAERFHKNAPPVFAWSLKSKQVKTPVPDTKAGWVANEACDQLMSIMLTRD